MYQDFNNPSYYRAHQFKNQLELPNGALKNRSIPQTYSQIPQGKEFFQPTNKKHYQTLAHQSQIQQQRVLEELLTQQEMIRSRIAMDKSYFRSLNVDDIQGAKPNTLISKAVKNKQKALQLKKQQLKSKQQQRVKISNQGYFQSNKIGLNGISLLNQYQAQQKLRKFKVQQGHQGKQATSYSPNNFHFSSRNIEKYDLNSQRSDNLKTNKINYEHKYEQSKLNQQQKRIKQLQKQLALQKSRGRINISSNQNSQNDLYQKSLKTQSNFQNQKLLVQKRNKQILQRESQHLNNIQIQNKKLYSNPYEGKKYTNNDDYMNKINIQNLENNYQQKNRQNQQYVSIRQQDLYKQRVNSNPYIQQKKPINNIFSRQANQSNNKSIQNLNSGINDHNYVQGQGNNYMQGNKSLIFDDKTQYRKYNPTFLSYGSSNGINSITLAGKNIVNQ